MIVIVYRFICWRMSAVNVSLDVTAATTSGAFNNLPNDLLWAHILPNMKYGDFCNLCLNIFIYPTTEEKAFFRNYVLPAWIMRPKTEWKLASPYFVERLLQFVFLHFQLKESADILARINLPYVNDKTFWTDLTLECVLDRMIHCNLLNAVNTLTFHTEKEEVSSIAMSICSRNRRYWYMLDKMIDYQYEITALHLLESIAFDNNVAFNKYIKLIKNDQEIFQTIEDDLDYLIFILCDTDNVIQEDRIKYLESNRRLNQALNYINCYRSYRPNQKNRNRIKKVKYISKLFNLPWLKYAVTDMYINHNTEMYLLDHDSYMEYTESDIDYDSN